MSFTLGIVSNCWSALLPDSSLDAECRRAVDRGYEYVELRQRALAECEELVAGDARPWPVPEKLVGLRERLPELGYNLAVEAPFMTEPLAFDAYLHRCAEAAVALGGEPPVLRLVDVSPAPALLESGEAIAALGEGVAETAVDLWKLGVRVALEHSKQPVRALRSVMNSAASRLPEGVPAPQLCWDPHNQIAQQFLAESPVDTARTLAPGMLFEFHFKQSCDGMLQGDVLGGEIDWRAILSALKAGGYHGPALFEIPPGPDAWERLDRSTQYIRGLIEHGN